MPSDDDDTPKGALIAMALLTCVVFFIVIGTFDKVTNLEGDKIKNYCSAVRFSMEPSILENEICLTYNGTLKLSIVNAGDIDIEGISVEYLGTQFNTSEIVFVQSSKRFSINIGSKSYELMAPVKIIPMVYYPKTNSTVLCENVLQTIKNTRLCSMDR